MKPLVWSCLTVTLLLGQWSTDPAQALDLGNGIQPQVAVTPDGGAYVAWLTESTFHIYLQRLDANGVPQWAQSGLLISSQPVDTWIAIHHLNLAVDTDGNAVLTTVDLRTGSWKIYAYKVSPDGTALWGADGIALSASGHTNLSPRLAVLPADNSVVVTWMDDYTALRLQRLDAAGNTLWQNGGISVSDPNAALLNPEPLISDDGLILLQYIRQTGSFPATQNQVLVAKYDLNGTVVW
ncbi:MAG: hypothetical protein D6762_05730, partial [Candidatus Neomarinimicrobiota bacterium]